MDNLERLRELTDKLILDEELLGFILEHFPDGVLVSNREGRIIVVNERVLEIFGYEKQSDLAGKNLDILVPKEYHEMHRRGVREHADNEDLRRIMPRSVPGLAADGRHICLSITLSRRFANGYVVAAIRLCNE